METREFLNELTELGNGIDQAEEATYKAEFVQYESDEAAFAEEAKEAREQAEFEAELDEVWGNEDYWNDQ